MGKVGGREEGKREEGRGRRKGGGEGRREER